MMAQGSHPDILLTYKSCDGYESLCGNTWLRWSGVNDSHRVTLHCTSGSGYGVILRISPDIWYESRSHAVLNMTSLDRLRTFHSFVLTFPYDHVILRDTYPFINGFAFNFLIQSLSLIRSPTRACGWATGASPAESQWSSTFTTCSGPTTTQATSD